MMGVRLFVLKESLDSRSSQVPAPFDKKATFYRSHRSQLASALDRATYPKAIISIYTYATKRFSREKCLANPSTIRA